MVDVQYPPPRSRWERDSVGNITPGPLGVQEKEAVVPLADQQSDLANPPTESASPHTRPRSRRVLQQPKELPPVGRSALPKTSTPSQGRAEPQAPRQLGGGQISNEPPATREEPPLPRLCEGVQVQTRSESAGSDPVERPQTTGEHATPALTIRDPRQQPAPIQRRDSDKAANEGDKVLRKEGTARDRFADISWEGWGLIKTPDGFYLPETFDPFPHELEDLTDQW